MEEEDEDTIMECRDYKIVKTKDGNVRINYCQKCGGSYVQGYQCGCRYMSESEKKRNLNIMKYQRKEFYS